MSSNDDGHKYFFGQLPEMPWKNNEKYDANEMRGIPMLICEDCGSHNIAEVSVWQTYMREGDYVRLRSFMVKEDVNTETEEKKFMAFCPELSKTATAIGLTQIDAIEKLGVILKEMGLGKMVRNELK